MNVYRTLRLESTRDNKVCEDIVGYEHGITIFVITPLCDRKTIDLTDCKLAIFYGTKSDGHTVSNACYINDGKIYLPVSLQMTTSFGLMQGQLELQFEEGNIRFYGLNFNVLSSPITDGIESTDDSTLFEKFILAPTTVGIPGQVLTVSENGDVVWGSVTGDGGIAITDYNGLSNLPTINGKQIKGNLTSVDFLTSSDKAEIAEIIMSEYDSELLEVLGGE